MPWILVKKNLIQLSTILIIVASIFTLGLMDTQTSAQTKSSLNAEIESIQNRVNQINASLEDVTQLKDSFQEEVARVESEIAETNQLITDTDTAITGLEEEIARNNEQIIKLQEDITTLTKQIQANNHISPLQNLLSSRDVGEAIGKMFTLSNTQSELDEKRMELEDLNAQKEANLTTQKELKEQLESTKSILNQKKSGLDALIETYRGQESKYAEEIGKLKSQQNQINNQIEAIEAEKARAEREASNRRQTSSPPSGGGGSISVPPRTGVCSFEDGSYNDIPKGFFSPPMNTSQNRGMICSGSCYIGSPYCHDAIDYSGSHGSTVYASADGVIIANASGSCYGNYVLIKHQVAGREIYSLYAHLSAFNRGLGPVSKGEAIGRVGRTGCTNGAHLHFMIYGTYNGLGCAHGSSYCFDPNKVF
jgi:murein DD-endopeptidase MepM/ murein hydrolase activator NlpD